MKLNYKKIQSFLSRHQSALVAGVGVTLFVALSLDPTDLEAAKDDALRGPVEHVVGFLKGNLARGAVAAGALTSLVFTVMKSTPLPILMGLGGILGYGGLTMYIDTAHAALI